VSFSYNLKTPVGQIRLLIADTNKVDPVFGDEELDVLYSLHGQNLFLAAAGAIGSIMADRARLAKVITREGYQTSQRAMDELAIVQRNLEKRSITNSGLQFTELQLGDEHFESYRHEWYNLYGDECL
jgi:hypothetical protein